MSLQTRPLHPTLACEIDGLRLWEPLDAATVAELRQLWSNWGVLVFRRQALSEAELAAFCALFGPLERTVRSDWASPSVPEVTVLSNLKDGFGHPIGGLGDGELQWHSDQSYMVQPATGAALYALELPRRAARPFGSICALPMARCRGGSARGSAASAAFSITQSGSPAMGGTATRTSRRRRGRRRRRSRMRWSALIPKPATVRSISIRPRPSASTAWTRSPARPCSKKCTQPRPATRSSMRMNGGSATLSCGTTALRCTGAPRSIPARAG